MLYLFFGWFLFVSFSVKFRFFSLFQIVAATHFLIHIIYKWIDSISCTLRKWRKIFIFSFNFILPLSGRSQALKSNATKRSWHYVVLCFFDSVIYLNVNVIYFHRLTVWLSIFRFRRKFVVSLPWQNMLFNFIIFNFYFACKRLIYTKSRYKNHFITFAIYILYILLEIIVCYNNNYKFYIHPESHAPPLTYNPFERFVLWYY